MAAGPRVSLSRSRHCAVADPHDVAADQARREVDCPGSALSLGGQSRPSCSAEMAVVNGGLARLP